MEDLVGTVGKLIREKASIRKVAMGVNMDRSQLIRSLRKGIHPRIDTIVRILDYLGYELQIVESKSKQNKQRRI
jgi:DNA-binding phage protein